MKVGIIFGVFDLLHYGHIQAFAECRKRCDVLWVGVFTDAVVRSYKPQNSVMNEQERFQLVQDCPLVDKALLIHKREATIDTEVDIFFTSSVYRNTPLYCVPTHRLKDVIWIPYTRGISTTQLRKGRKGKRPSLI